MSKPFILNDQSVKNSHGFYLLNAGARWERFDANPVMLDNHKQDIAGRWLNRRTEGALLIADPEFDAATTIGAERQGQAERGFLNGASLGIEILSAEIVGDEVYVTDWEPFEASVTPVPSNARSLQLKIYDHNGSVIEDGKVKAHLDGIVKLSATTNNLNIPIINNMDKIQLTAAAVTTLGISDTADASAISAAIVTLAADRDAYKAKMEAYTKKAAEDLIDLALKEGKITADRRDAFVRLALADPETTKATLDGIPTKQSLSGQINPIGAQNGIPADRKSWTLLRWMREDGAELNRIRSEDPETFELIKTVR